MAKIVLQLICVVAAGLLAPVTFWYSKRDHIKFEICCWLIVFLGVAILLLT